MSTVLIDIDIVINTMSTVLIDIDIVINTTIYNDMPKNLNIDDIDIYRDIYRPCMHGGRGTLVTHTYSTVLGSIKVTKYQYNIKKYYKYLSLWVTLNGLPNGCLLL